MGRNGKEEKVSLLLPNVTHVLVFLSPYSPLEIAKKKENIKAILFWRKHPDTFSFYGREKSFVFLACCICLQHAGKGFKGVWRLGIKILSRGRRTTMSFEFQVSYVLEALAQEAVGVSFFVQCCVSYYKLKHAL